MPLSPSEREASQVVQISMEVDLHRLGYDVPEHERGVDVDVQPGERGRRIRLSHGARQWETRGGERATSEADRPRDDPEWLADVFEHVEQQLGRGVRIT